MRFFSRTGAKDDNKKGGTGAEIIPEPTPDIAPDAGRGGGGEEEEEKDRPQGGFRRPFGRGSGNKKRGSKQDLPKEDTDVPVAEPENKSKTTTMTKKKKHTLEKRSNRRSSSSSDAIAAPFTIYQEALEMLTGALVIYLFAEIREMIRESNDPKAQKKKKQQEEKKKKKAMMKKPTSGRWSRRGKKNLNEEELEQQEALDDDHHQEVPPSPTFTLEDFMPPLKSSEIVQKIEEQSEALEKRAVDHEELAKRLQELDNLRKAAQEQQQQGKASKRGSSSSSLSFLHSVFTNNQKNKSSKRRNDDGNDEPILTHFVDDNAKQEIVHATVVNPWKKRVTVIFRGSVTPKDFIQDAKCVQKKVPNPLVTKISKTSVAPPVLPDLNPEHVTEMIGIHTGFYQYLFHEQKVKQVENDGKKKTKNGNSRGERRLDSILNDVKALLRQPEYAGYSLYCTGHSLGGALCTLFGFYAACDDELWALTQQQPVVVYSVASPYVGNWKFRRAFATLERYQRIQHLRIANLEDMVTLLPFAAPKGGVSSLSPAYAMMSHKGAGNLYKHVGIRLHFYEQPKAVAVAGQKKSKTKQLYSISYPIDEGAEEDVADIKNNGNNEGHDDDEEHEDEEAYASSTATELQDAMEHGKSLAKAFYAIVSRDFAKVLQYHSCPEYERRLFACEDALVSRGTLSDLYADRALVGRMMDHDYVPPPMISGYERTKRVMGGLMPSSLGNSKNDRSSDSVLINDQVEEEESYPEVVVYEEDDGIEIGTIEER